ncbi:MAG: isovaleryl-CoA dehydrogenase [Candidatus Accumulibacter sp.]|nr:isovaleryl-CoA dehydrogenase [Accumulibacter sp.]
MDFSLSDEQVMLKDSVTRFVGDRHGFDSARAHAASRDGFSRADWASFADLGWLMLMIPEAQGGLGGRLEDAAILMEGFGRGLVAAPYVSTAVVAAGLLARTGGADALLAKIAGGETLLALATEEPRSRYDLLHVETEARVADGGFVLRGAKIVVPDGASADHFIVSARLSKSIALFLVAADAPGLEIRRYRTIDGRRACDLAFADVPATPLMHDAADALARAVDEASLLFAAEAVGGMAAAIDLTADYLKTRQQFGRTLSKFQVLTHRVADMFVKLENARSMLLRGLAAADGAPEQRAAAVSATMVTIIQAGEFVCGQAIQLHGGIGMADDYAVGHYYKRLRAIARTYGDLDFHRQRHLRLTVGDRGAA